MVDFPWIRKEVIGDCTLYQGDMRDVLPALPEKADLCATDAPYKLTSGGRSASMGGKFHPDRYDNKGELMQVVPWKEMGVPIHNALKDQADLYVMTSGDHVSASQIAFQASGFKHHTICTWNKISPPRSRYYMKVQEFTHFMWKGPARDVRDGGVKTLFTCPAPRGLDWHPTPKPTALMAQYVLQSSDAGWLVLDPFMGAGATILAALAFGRRAIGVEIDPLFFDMTCARIKAAYLNGFQEIRDDWEHWRVENRIKGHAYAA